MEMMLFFKDHYTSEEKEQSKVFCAKLFGSKPCGIGIRELLSCELISLMDIVDTVEDETLREDIFDDLMSLYRTGDCSNVIPENRSFLSGLCRKFINLCRLRMTGATGIPTLVDMVTGRKVSTVDIFQSAVEERFRCIREFNEFLAYDNVYNDYEVLLPSAISRIMEFVKRANEDKEIMFIQAVMYYDLQTRFVVDAGNFILDGVKYDWRRLLGSPGDEIVQFRGVMFCLQYLPIAMLSKMKYFSKYNYELFKYKRRISSYSPDFIPRESPFTGCRLWCSAHNQLFCNHRSTGGTSSYPLSFSCSREELSLFSAIFSTLSVSDTDQLKRLFSTRPCFEVFSIVVSFLIAKGYKTPSFSSFVKRNRQELLMGMMLSRTNCSKVVEVKLSDYFRKQDYWFVSKMYEYDVREDGLEISDRIKNPGIVDSILGTRNLLSGIEDLFSRPCGSAPRRIGTQGDDIIQLSNRVFGANVVRDLNLDLGGGDGFDADADIDVQDDRRPVEFSKIDSASKRRRQKKRKIREKKKKQL